MKKSILITGIAGSGKSTVCEELKRKGYKTYDIEDMEGLFSMIDKETGKVFREFDNDDLEKVRRAKWVCDVEKLRKLIEHGNNEIAFYCGTASNLDEILPLFEVVVVLKSSPEVLRQRLSSREPGNFGRTREVQDWIMSWKDESEKEVEKKGAIVIDADSNPEEVVKNTIKVIANKKLGE